MKHLFIPYELAVIAKDKGFNEAVISWWDVHDNIIFSACEEGIEINQTGFVSRPMYQQIIDWFELKHKILITPRRIADNNFAKKWYCELNKDFEKTKIGSGNFVYYLNNAFVDDNCQNFSTKYKALNAAIEEAFKLIN